MPQQLKRNEVDSEGERWSGSQVRRTVGCRDKRRYTLMTRRVSGRDLDSDSALAMQERSSWRC